MNAPVPGTTAASHPSLVITSARRWLAGAGKPPPARRRGRPRAPTPRPSLEPLEPRTTVSDALFRAGLMIVRSEIATLRGRVVDRFYVRELDGRRVARRRVATIRGAVLESLDPRGELAPPPAAAREVGTSGRA